MEKKNNKKGKKDFLVKRSTESERGRWRRCSLARVPAFISLPPPTFEDDNGVEGLLISMASLGGVIDRVERYTETRSLK